MLLILAGASSFLGSYLIEKLADTSNTNDVILALRRSSSVALIQGLELWVARGGSFIEVDWDATCTNDSQIIRGQLGQLLSQHNEVTFIYTCGYWFSGPITHISDLQLSDITQVNFLSPARLLRDVLLGCRAAKIKNAQFIVVSGMGGERGVVPYNAIFGATTTAIQNFVRSMAMENANTQYTTFCVALGLMDKKQPYIKELCSQLVTGVPTPVEEISQFLEDRVRNPSHAFNGALIELSSGLLSYEMVCRYFSKDGELKNEL